jgi:hypothetical protein
MSVHSVIINATSDLLSTSGNSFKSHLPIIGLKDKTSVRDKARTRLRARQLSLEKSQGASAEKKTRKGLNLSTPTTQLTTAKQLLEQRWLSQVNVGGLWSPHKVSIGTGEELCLAP